MKNEPILDFREGSKERVELLKVKAGLLPQQQEPRRCLTVSSLSGLKQGEDEHGGDPVCGWRPARVDRPRQIPAFCESAGPSAPLALADVPAEDV